MISDTSTRNSSNYETNIFITSAARTLVLCNFSLIMQKMSQLCSTISGNVKQFYHFHKDQLVIKINSAQWSFKINHPHTTYLKQHLHIRIRFKSNEAIGFLFFYYFIYIFGWNGKSIGCYIFTCYSYYFGQFIQNIHLIKTR